MFKGVLIQKDEIGYHAACAELEESALPVGDVTVAVEYSTLNYKDGLAIVGKGPIVRQFPMVPGIDLAGKVIHSASVNFRVGDEVILNGWGVGESHWGGLAQKARVRSEWLMPKPAGLTAKQTMMIGTAGYTAMLSVMALERQGIMPDSGDVLVTGASGGVGGFAIALLSRLGYRVVASTGRVEEKAYLMNVLGAAEVIDRHELSSPSKPLLKSRWAAAIDSVGSHTLANVCASLDYGGVVAACGLAQGMDFPTTVAPFILRGVTLVGIDSVMCPMAERVVAWSRLATLVDDAWLLPMQREIGLSETITAAQDLLAGRVRGRLLVDVNR